MSDDIEYLTAAMYAAGKDAITVAESRTATLIEVYRNLLQRQANGLPPLPAWQEVSDDAAARKIIGTLLDAGWQPPSDDTVAAAAERVRQQQERTDEWWASLTPDQRRRGIEHYSNHGEFPPDLGRPS